MKKVIYRIIFFLGWLLSPFTLWNDALVNIPIAYILASITVWFRPWNFLFLTIFYYWFTNALGIVLMIAGGQKIFLDRARAKREISILFITITLYSALIIVLDKAGWLQPIHVFFQNISK